MIQIRSSRGINDIPITSMDNLDTFRQRVAASLGTIPSYLLFESEIESLDALKTMKSIGVLSLMDSINDLKQKFGKEEFSTESLFALASRFPDINKNDIFAYWVIKNPALEDINYRMLIDEEISSIEGITPISDILETERKENRWMKTYTDAVASNKTKSSKFLKVATEFEKVTSVESSSIVIEKITI